LLQTEKKHALFILFLQNKFPSVLPLRYMHQPEVYSGGHGLLSLKTAQIRISKLRP